MFMLVYNRFFVFESTLCKLKHYFWKLFLKLRTFKTA